MSQSLIDVIAEVIFNVLLDEGMSAKTDTVELAAKVSLKAIHQAGYVVAPKEPTEPQLSAFLKNCKFSNVCCGCNIDSYDIGSWSDGVKAMLSASK